MQESINYAPTKFSATLSQHDPNYSIIVVMVPSRFFFLRTRRLIFVNAHTARAQPLNVHSRPYEVQHENGLPSTLLTTSGGYLV